MVFNITGKVAMITGGGRGLGFQFAKHLLKNGLKAVTIAEKNLETGKKAAEDLCKEFGPNSAKFVRTDVTESFQVINAFERTYSNFESLDIVINNAGIGNETSWGTEMEINFCGVVRSSILAMEEYIPKYRFGREGVLVNIASVAGLDPLSCIPVYSASKFGVVGLGRSLGHEEIYKKFRVKVLTICPGLTTTSIFSNIDFRYADIEKTEFGSLPQQSVEYVGSALPQIIKDGKTGSVWVVENSEEPYEVQFPGRHEMKKPAN